MSAGAKSSGKHVIFFNKALAGSLMQLSGSPSQYFSTFHPLSLSRYRRNYLEIGETENRRIAKCAGDLDSDLTPMPELGRLSRKELAIAPKLYYPHLEIDFSDRKLLWIRPYMYLYGISPLGEFRSCIICDLRNQCSEYRDMQMRAEASPPSGVLFRVRIFNILLIIEPFLSMDFERIRKYPIRLSSRIPRALWELGKSRCAKN